MARNYYEPDTGNSPMGIFAGVVAGALVGATALFLADERNRKRIKSSVDDWKEKGGRSIHDIEEKVSDEIDKGKQKIDKEKRRIAK